MKKRYELYDGINPDPIHVEERDATPFEMAFSRKEALSAKWPDAFALLDDILERGINEVKTERAAIKAANPKE